MVGPAGASRRLERYGTLIDAAPASAPARPLRVALIGLGEMGVVWISSILARSDVELVGIVARRPHAASVRARDLGVTVPVVGTLEELLGKAAVDAVINATPPDQHHATTIDALARGIDVLSEKPLADSLSAALSLIAHAQVSGRLLMISQSRRYHPELFQLRHQIAGLGTLAFATADFFRAPRFKNFRDAMEHPLLTEMAIHAFDSARFLLDTEPVAVLCDEFNPPWSWYAGSACVSATFQMASGARFIFTGSWCSEGLETSWNSSWRISGEAGTTLWDGEQAPIVSVAPSATTRSLRFSSDDPIPGFHTQHGIDGALTEFLAALRTGVTPYGEAHSNLLSFAMVESATLSSQLGCRVYIADALAAALRSAVEAEPSLAAKTLMEEWESNGIPFSRPSVRSPS